MILVTSFLGPTVPLSCPGVDVPYQCAATVCGWMILKYFLVNPLLLLLLLLEEKHSSGKLWINETSWLLEGERFFFSKKITCERNRHFLGVRANWLSISSKYIADSGTIGQLYSIYMTLGLVAVQSYLIEEQNKISSLGTASKTTW